MLIALAFLPRTAFAGDGVCATDQGQCTQGEAFAVCQTNLEFSKQRISKILDGSNYLVPVVRKACTPAANSAKQFDCDVGATTRSSYYGCFTPSTVRQDFTRYVTNCLNMPPMAAKLVNGLTGGSVCLDGCIYVSGSTVPDSFELGDAPTKIVTLTTNWTPNGDVCDISTPDPKPKDEPECLKQGGLTQCVKKDGSHCASASTGKEFCWGKGDNEPSKNDGNDYANRGQNGPAPPPAVPPSGGGVWGPPKPENCRPMSSTVNGYRQTYTVCGGSREPPDGDGDNDGPDGPDEPCDPATETCEPGSSTGGDDCAAPPSSTGDPLLAAIIKQQWYVRCGKSKADADGDGQPDWTKPGSGDYTETGPDNDPEEVSTLGLSTGLLDTSGMVGGGSCPNIGAIDIAGLATVSVDAEPWWCPMISLMRGVVLMMAAFTALRLLMGES